MAAPARVGPQSQIAPVAPTAKKKRRISTGHIVMIVAGLLGAALTLLALQAADAKATVVVASDNLSAGTRLDANAVTTKRVRIDDALRATVLTPDNAATYSGAILLIPVKSGEPIPKSALAKSATLDGRRALSMPIAPERAVGGRIHNGDRVDVYTTGSKGGLVTTNVEVLDVIHTDNGPLAAKNSLTVVLAVTNAQATKIAPIVGSDDVVLVQATGATPNGSESAPTPAPTAVPVTPVVPEAAQPVPGG